MVTRMLALAHTNVRANLAGNIETEALKSLYRLRAGDVTRQLHGVAKTGSLMKWKRMALGASASSK